MNRQRNLTWIEKKQIEKIAFDHPFFDTHGTVLSKKEAKAIIHSAEMRKSGTEIVTEACDRAGVPRPDFVDNHYTVFENLKEVIAIPAIRRIGIIAIALILLIVFFTATPTGRAIAESVIQYFSTLLDDGKIIISKSDYESTLISADETSRIDDGDQDERDDIDMYIFVNSFDDFSKATGKIPFVLSLPHTEIYYIDDPEIDYLMLHSKYLTPKGEIATYQIWNAEDMSSTTLSGFTVYDADKGIYYSIEEDIDYIHCKMVLNDSVLTLSSNGDYTLNELIELLTIH